MSQAWAQMGRRPGSLGQGRSLQSRCSRVAKPIMLPRIPIEGPHEARCEGKLPNQWMQHVSRHPGKKLLDSARLLRNQRNPFQVSSRTQIFQRVRAARNWREVSVDMTKVDEKRSRAHFFFIPPPDDSARPLDLFRRHPCRV